jgi:hypothetical protein
MRLHLAFFGSMVLSYLPTQIPNCRLVGSGYPGFALKVHVINKQLSMDSIYPPFESQEKGEKRW